MMGPHHAACGAAAWLVVATQPVINLPENSMGWESLKLGFGLIPDMTPTQALVTTVFATGAALLPDIDHHSSTITRSLPPITNIASKLFGSMSGGHRHGTHTILASILFTLAAFFASSWVVDLPDPWGTISIGTGLFSVILIAMTLVTFKIVRSSKVGIWILSVILSLLISLNTPDSWYWLPLAVGIGVVAHIAGDFLTVGGVPLFRIYFLGKVLLDLTPPAGNYLGIVVKKTGFVSFPILGKTSSRREWALASVIGGYAVIAFGMTLISVVSTISVS